MTAARQSCPPLVLLLALLGVGPIPVPATMVSAWPDTLKFELTCFNIQGSIFA
jgi:hypothetical protein